MLLISKLMRPAAAVWTAAVRDIGRGALIVGRGAVGLIGLSALSVAVALLASEQARERLMAAALSAVAVDVTLRPVPSGGPPNAESAPPATRWTDWLASQNVHSLEPPQEHVARYLSRRYRVAENAVRRIVGEAFSTGRSIGVDPMLILAVMAIESSMNPFAQSTMGAQGLMQVMTRVHSEKFELHGGDHAALDPIANLKVGAEILKDLIRRGGSVERGLQLYVGAGNLPDDGGYAGRVLGEMARIRLASTGDVRAALSAGWRVDNGTDSKVPSILPTGASSTGPAATSKAPAAAT